MMPAAILEHDGVRQSITEWALDYGITPAIIIARIERGMGIADAITTPMKVGHRGQRLANPDMETFIKDNVGRWKRERRKVRPLKSKPLVQGRKALMLTYRGETLPLMEWAERTGLKAVTIRARVYAGWEMERVLTTAPNPLKTDACRAAQARAVGIDPRTVDSRIRRGWPLELALSEQPGTRMGRFAHGRPGVVSDFPPSRETGAWGSSQETPNITFSGNEA